MSKHIEQRQTTSAVYSVMVAVGEKSAREYIQETLASRYQVQIIADPASAYKEALKQSPSIILLGKSVASSTAEKRPNDLKTDPRTCGIPVIGVCVELANEYGCGDASMEVDDYITLPTSRKAILARVRNLITLAEFNKNMDSPAHEERLTASRDSSHRLLDVIGSTPRILDSASSVETLADKIAGEARSILRAHRAELVVHLAGKTIKVTSESEQDAPPILGWLEVPLKRPDGDIAGSIQVSAKFFGGFTEQDQAILTQLAVIATAAIDVTIEQCKLREQSSHKDKFLATLAHELRSPIAPLKMGLDLMERTEDAANLKAMMERQLGHMTRLIDDLMDVSRVSRGKIELRWEHVALQELVDLAVETSRPFIEASGHRFDVVMPDNPMYLNGDITRLCQILNNLLNNSARYTPEGGAIGLRAEAEDDSIYLRVTDNGIGISKEKLPKIFKLFTQLDPAVGQSHDGLGIGLSLVHKLVKLHGGRVWAESPGVGGGATFCVQLPLLLLDASTRVG